MRRSAVMAGVLVAGSALASAGATAAPAGPAAAMTIRGIVTDAAGATVPAATVRVLKTRRVKVLGASPDADQAVEEARSRTDAEGRFVIDVPVDHAFPFWFVRFYDQKTFDVVKYSVPRDADISRQVREGSVIETGTVLQFHPDWPKVRALVDEYGAASRRGQILRSLGLPTRRLGREEGREIWEYDAAGVAYVIEGDRVLETRSYAPAAGEGPGRKDEAVPAERVEGS